MTRSDRTPDLSVELLLDQACRQSTVPIQLGLERVERLLEAMGTPQQGLACVHVAGTNGKGSVLAFLEAILRHAGYRVGVYTSPHLQCVNERIRVDGQWIGEGALARWLAAVLAANAGGAATFFELLTVVALCHFRDQGLGQNAGPGRGIVLLETGLGGRLDATNVLRPLLSIVTAIGMDHTEYLGTDLVAIAAEKAGIFKPGVPAVAAPAPPEVEALLRRQARQTGTPLSILGRDFFLCPPPRFSPLPSSDNTWWFQEGEACHELPMPGLPGRHQLENAALAIAGVHRLQAMGWPVAEASMETGVREARWPGRLERLPLHTAHGPSPTILLDGAHNVAGTLALADFLLESRQRGIQPLFLIFSAMQDKEVEAMARLLAPCVERVWTTRVGGERGHTAEYLAALWQRLDRPASACATPAEALAAASAACPPGGEVVVCGSLYLVGAVRALLVPEDAQDKTAPLH